MKRTWLSIVSLLALTAGAAKADVLWDQFTFDPFGAGYFNSESGEPPLGITMYAVNDIVVDGAGWTVDTITTAYSFLDPEWGLSIAQAYLHVFPKTGPLPIDGSDDPTSSPLVAASAAFVTDHWEVQANGLALDLAPGEYWVGITPIAPSGFFGPEIQFPTVTYIGDPTASYDPFGIPAPAWLVTQPDLDATILIEGTANDPTPVVEASWGTVKSEFRNN